MRKLTDTDSEALKAALERLEADREQFIEERIARDEAIRATPPLEVFGLAPDNEDEYNERRKAEHIGQLRKAGETREIYFDDNAATMVITGVPRAGREPDGDELDERMRKHAAQVDALKDSSPWRPQRQPQTEA